MLLPPLVSLRVREKSPGEDLGVTFHQDILLLGAIMAQNGRKSIYCYAITNGKTPALPPTK